MKVILVLFSVLFLSACDEVLFVEACAKACGKEGVHKVNSYQCECRRECISGDEWAGILKGKK